MNSCNIIGNLTKDPELRYTTNSNLPVCSFTVAVNEGNEQVEFINCTAWKTQAENCHKYLRKGDKVGVEGKFHTRTWNDDSGAKHYASEITAFRVEFLNTMNTDQKEQPKEPDDDMPF